MAQNKPLQKQVFVDTYIKIYHKDYLSSPEPWANLLVKLIDFLHKFFPSCLSEIHWNRFMQGLCLFW